MYKLLLTDEHSTSTHYLPTEQQVFILLHIFTKFYSNSGRKVLCSITKDELEIFSEML